jgi:hypothetical protein
MKERIGIFGFGIVILMMFFYLLSMSVGCSMVDKDLTPEQRYLEALGFFNDASQQYIDAYDMASVKTKAEFKKEIDPIIREADLSLRAWKLFLNSSNADSKEKVWLEIRNKLLMILINYDILVVRQ